MGGQLDELLADDSLLPCSLTIFALFYFYSMYGDK